MLKKFVIFALMFVLLVPSVQAASDVYMVLESESTSGCPCNAMGNMITVTNTGDSTDTFTFSLDLPEGWTGFIGPSKVFAVGETKKIPFYVTPACFIEAGNYVVTVTAKTSDGREFSNNVDVEILTCHFVKIEAEELTKTCVGFPADYEDNRKRGSR